MSKVILISGGSDGIGKETGRQLSRAGHTVVLLSRNEEKLAAAAKELGCDFLVADVSDAKAVETAVNDVLKRHGRIDCLINNAGLWIEGDIDGYAPDRIQEVLSVNTLGTIFLTHAAVPSMKGRKAGLILNVISQAGLYAKPQRSVYNASKWAITGFTKSLEQELSGHGIRVCGVYPGKVATGLFEKAGITKEMGNAVSAETVAKAIAFVVDADPDVIIPELGIKRIGG